MVAGQFGTFGGASIRAWSVGEDVGYTLDQRCGRPRLTLGGDGRGDADSAK